MSIIYLKLISIYIWVKKTVTSLWPRLMGESSPGFFSFVTYDIVYPEIRWFPEIGVPPNHPFE